MHSSNPLVKVKTNGGWETKNLDRLFVEFSVLGCMQKSSS